MLSSTTHIYNKHAPSSRKMITESNYSNIALPAYVNTGLLTLLQVS